MKKINSLLLTVILIFSMFSILSACGKNASEGLQFKSNGDGTCVWTGLGTCTDTEIIVPESNNEETVIAVGEEVLKRKEGITKVTLPNSVIELYEDAFAYNNSLIEINLGNNLEVIGKNAIGHCENLSKISLPNSLKTIKSLAFSFDTALTEIILPDGVETIEFGAFANTTAVKKIVIPSSVNEFSTSIFCTKSLEELEIKSEMKYFALSLNTDAAGNTAISGGVCVDPQKTDLPNTYEGICKKENLASIICAILDKKTIKLNGEQVTPSSTISTGKYSKQDNMYAFEITANSELIVSFGAAQKNEIARLKYTTDTSSNAIYATGLGNLSNSSINLDVTIIPLGDTIFVIMGADNENIIGLWNKN